MMILCPIWTGTLSYRKGAMGEYKNERIKLIYYTSRGGVHELNKKGTLFHLKGGSTWKKQNETLFHQNGENTLIKVKG